jgi:hypothetical protein
MLAKAISKGNGIPAVKGWLQGIYLFWTVGITSRRTVQAMRRVSINYLKGMLWHDLPPDQTGLRKFRKFFTGK